jgi:hypothetical protein
VDFCGDFFAGVAAGLVATGCFDAAAGFDAGLSLAAAFFVFFATAGLAAA